MLCHKCALTHIVLQHIFSSFFFILSICTDSMRFLHSPFSDMITGNSCRASPVPLYNWFMKDIVVSPCHVFDPREEAVIDRQTIAFQCAIANVQSNLY